MLLKKVMPLYFEPGVGIEIAATIKYAAIISDTNASHKCIGSILFKRVVKQFNKRDRLLTNLRPAVDSVETEERGFNYVDH